jgi:hypothetical protein
MRWITCHQAELQAISGLAIVFLTVVLIVLNFFYTRANWKTMRLVDADVRFKLKPIPHFGLDFLHDPTKGTKREFIITLRAEHAPMRLTGVDLFFGMGSESKNHLLTFAQEVVDENAQTRTYSVDLPKPVTTWAATLYYRDLSGYLDYATSFGEKGYVGEGTTIDRHAIVNRLRFRYRRWRQEHNT